MTGQTATYSVGQLAGRVGLTAQAIRYYQAEGLLPEPARTPAGYRRFDAAALSRLMFIRRARTLGLTLEEIREISRLADSGRAPCGKVRELLGRKLRDLDQRIEELTALREQLGHFVKKIGDLPDRADTSSAVCYLIETVSLEEPPAPRGRRERTTAQRKR